MTRALIILLILAGVAFGAYFIAQRFFGYTITPAGTHVTTQVGYYDVQAPTLSEAAYQMLATGTGTGADGIGKTTWFLEWSFPKFLWATCTTDPYVKVSVRHTLPHWTMPEGASSEDKQKWEQFITALRDHQYGHNAIAVKAGDDMKRALQRLFTEEAAANTPCEELEAQGHEIARSIRDEMERLQHEYDKGNDHGESQGAYLKVRN